MPLADPWHYHRNDLTQQYFAQLDQRLASALVLFGQRRTGKTEFLLNDLGPMAQAEGWNVAYATFWQSNAPPTDILLHALSLARDGGSLIGRAQALADHAELTLSAGPLASAKIDPSKRGAAPDPLLRLDTAIGKFAPKQKRALLLLDEVQDLATPNAQNHAFIAALRSSLDKRKQTLAVVFTGSSQEGLRAMFSKRNAPFFHYGAELDWPPFDDGLADHTIKTFAKVVGGKLDRTRLIAALEALDRNPFYFRKLVAALALDPKRNIENALAKVRADLADELAYPDAWKALTPLQRALAWTIAKGAEQPFSAQSLKAIGKVAGIETPTRVQALAAIRLLLRRDILRKDEGRANYAFNDALFANWIARTRA